MPRPCRCNNCNVGPYGPGQCRLCWLYYNSEEYRKSWNRPVMPEVTADGSNTCVNLGPEGDSVDCGTCAGRVKLKTYSCTVHGRCTLGKKVDGMGCCEGCTDYARPALVKPIVRNLLYHIYPLSSNEVWKWNVGQVKQRGLLFNGKKTVAIVTGHGLVEPETVQKEFGEGYAFITIANDPGLREVKSFEPLFESVESLDPHQVTLYAHSKGVTRVTRPEMLQWTNILYETYMDYWPLVEQLLDSHPLAGSFRKVGHGWSLTDTKSDWHYSGSFLWFRNRDLYRKADWKRIDKFWSGIEPWPSLHFRAHEAACIFMDGKVGEMDMYRPDYISEVVLPTYEAWKKRYQQLKREC